MKEMTLSHSEPFHFMEFRHGPKSMITASALVVGLLSGANASYEEAVLEEMRTMGARVLKLVRKRMGLPLSPAWMRPYAVSWPCQPARSWLLSAPLPKA